VRRCLRDPTFSRFRRTPTCDRRTDGWTDTRRQLIPVLASVERVINVHVTDRVQWVNGQLADAPTRGLDDSRTRQLAYWTSRRLDNLRMPPATLRA